MNWSVHNEKHCSLVTRVIPILMQLPYLLGHRIVYSPFQSLKNV